MSRSDTDNACSFCVWTTMVRHAKPPANTSSTICGNHTASMISSVRRSRLRVVSPTTMVISSPTGGSGEVRTAQRISVPSTGASK